jgi:hypothetical protein
LTEGEDLDPVWLGARDVRKVSLIARENPVGKIILIRTWITRPSKWFPPASLGDIAIPDHTVAGEDAQMARVVEESHGDDLFRDRVIVPVGLRGSQAAAI